ncbi:FAD-dependent oxidoreductase [Aquisalimonas sp.]|uniref:FAD-dependent oxidoreductase n=1 Tax=unclassified Aquisalimonas TaxID=2644645 RepID=UPI0025C6061B|nr:FAD-dependent oxidoreductase [Aquisalimonas sp.]
MNQAPACDVVLLGGGHSHVGVLRRLGLAPMPGARLTLVSRDRFTPYSGMLPGYVAGHYSFDDVHIDLSRLAAFAGARFIQDEAVALDRSRQRVMTQRSGSEHYDWLSINTGATPGMRDVSGADAHGVPVKPIHRFNERWLQLLQRVRDGRGPVRIVVVGAGAGGVELVLAMHYRLRGERKALGENPDDLQFHLVSGTATILPTHNRRVRRWFEAVLADRGVTVHRGARVAHAGPEGLTTVDGMIIGADEVVWTTSAAGAAWLGSTGLALDNDGFIRVRQTLQAVTDPRIFAAGDTATMDGFGREKAGVFAVRQGRPLAANLRRVVAGDAPTRYRPQSRWLALISTGDRHAVASRGAVSLRGRWVWRWKDWIDRRFMEQFARLPVIGR